MTRELFKIWARAVFRVRGCLSHILVCIIIPGMAHM